MLANIYRGANLNIPNMKGKDINFAHCRYNDLS